MDSDSHQGESVIMILSSAIRLFQKRYDLSKMLLRVLVTTTPTTYSTETMTLGSSTVGTSGTTGPSTTTSIPTATTTPPLTSTSNNHQYAVYFRHGVEQSILKKIMQSFFQMSPFKAKMHLIRLGLWLCPKPQDTFA